MSFTANGGLETVALGSRAAGNVINMNNSRIGSGLIAVGELADRPAAGSVTTSGTPFPNGARWWFATDTLQLFHDNGATWDLITNGGGPHFVSVYESLEAFPCTNAGGSEVLLDIPIPVGLIQANRVQSVDFEFWLELKGALTVDRVFELEFNTAFAVYQTSAIATMSAYYKLAGRIMLDDLNTANRIYFVSCSDALLAPAAPPGAVGSFSGDFTNVRVLANNTGTGLAAGDVEIIYGRVLYALH